jgi:hypothetical protein
MPASGNGDNAVWVGSTTAGLRLLVKGDDPLWQAGVPFDSRATPEPPTSWSVLPTPFAPLFSKNICSKRFWNVFVLSLSWQIIDRFVVI